MDYHRTLAESEEHLSPEQWARRLEDADAEAVVLEQALLRVHAGESRSSVVRSLLPDHPESSAIRRLRRYERDGRDGLVNRRLPVAPRPRTIDAEARGVTGMRWRWACLITTAISSAVTGRTINSGVARMPSGVTSNSGTGARSRE